MRNLGPTSGFGLCLALAAGCVTSSVPAGPDEVRLSATDFLGTPQSLSQLPRRPRLLLQHDHGLAADEQGYVLLPGAPTEALREDLQRAPVRAEHTLPQPAVVEQVVERGLAVTPERALDPDADYVLAVPSWAKSRRGTSLTHAGEPLLFALHTASGDDAGARVQATWPMDGASEVAPRLSFALVSFDGRIEGANAGIWLEGPDGLAAPAQVDSAPCAQLAPEQQQPYCARLRPTAPLAADTLYAIVVGAGAVDAHGAPVGPARAEFRTGASGDDAPPGLRAPECAVDELPLEFACALSDDGSVRLRSISDEAAIVSLRVAGKGLATTTRAGEFALRAGDLASDASLEIALRVLDSAGNAAEYRATLRTTPELATLSISEVLADPLGPEPHQEWIELMNYGERPIDLVGFTLSGRPDEVGHPLAVGGPMKVAPHTRALLVGAGYDPMQGSDPAPPPGVLLIRVGHALTGSGLSNTGEALFLRDAQGRRVSAAPAAPRPRAGVCAVRSESDMRDGSDGSFAPAETCTPGR